VIGRKIRYGMVGGGPGAFIGAVHRKAAALDGEIELVAGAFSSSPERSAQQGVELHLDADRVYGSYTEMATQEAARPDGDRIDFVSIVTPNDSHFEIAKTFIESGFHVVCDKPMTTSIEDAEELCRLVAASGCVFALTHNYTGYPMVKQARELVSAGKLGVLRKVVVEYPQGWLATLVEETGLKQAEWRTDPARAGVSSAIGDIGSHAENLVNYITRLEIESLIADISTFVPGRLLEDDANVLIHYKGGARGVLYASQISVGEENNLRIRVYGTEASLEWQQEHPNYLHVRYSDKPEEIYKRGNAYLSESAQHNSRLPSGHPEAFINAFANIYTNAARTIAARLAGNEPSAFDLDFPTVEDGARGVHFIHSVIRSGKKADWIDAEPGT
jgi:predicted dehydrogenase